MNGLRKLLGLVAIGSVLNPLCCCFANVTPAPKKEVPAAHSCCENAQASQQNPSKTPCGPESAKGCPQRDGAFQREMPADLHTVTAPQALQIAEFTFDYVGTSMFATVEQRVRTDERPPGRHDPPAYLRSHSFLN